MAYQVRMYRLPMVKNGRMEDERMTSAIGTPVSSRTPRWFTTVLVLLALIGLFNVFASVNDFIATNSAGLPSDHTGTFAKLSGTTWSNFKGGQSGSASYVKGVPSSRLTPRDTHKASNRPWG